MRDLPKIKTAAAAGSPVGGASPRADVGEIDLRAPFQSVKDALNLFGEAGSPKASTPRTKKRAEERLLEVEAQHQLMMKARVFYTHQLQTTEAAKAHALRELSMAHNTLNHLTTKLQTLTHSKESSMAATEAALIKAKDLEAELSRRSYLPTDTYEYLVNNERDLYKTTTAELAASKEELHNLRLHFDSLSADKPGNFQKAEEAEDRMRKSQARQSHLMEEVAELHRQFELVKAASLEAEEAYTKIMAEKEELLHNYKQQKEQLLMMIQSIEEAYLPPETLQERLEETMESIRVLQEQLHDIQTSDFDSIRNMAADLAAARRALEEAVAEENSLRKYIDSSTSELEHVKRKVSESEMAAEDAESAAEEMQAELDTSKAELEAAMTGCGFIMHSCVDKLLKEADVARQEAETNAKTAEKLRVEAKAVAAATQEADEKLKAALKEAEVAKAEERAVEERIYYYQGNNEEDKVHGTVCKRISMSEEEFERLNKKIEESGQEADVAIATAVAEVAAIKEREKGIAENLEEVKRKKEALESEIREALKRADMAEAARRLVENELQKWRRNEETI